MDKQKQIEEMAKVLDEYWGKHNTCPFDKNCPYLGGSVRFTCSDCMRANDIYNAGYRKIPEGAVVLTRERYEALLQEQKRLKEIVDRIPCGYELKEKTRKETAEKLLDKVDNESNGQTKAITDLLRKEYGVKVK